MSQLQLFFMPKYRHKFGASLRDVPPFSMGFNYGVLKKRRKGGNSAMHNFPVCIKLQLDVGTTDEPINL